MLLYVPNKFNTFMVLFSLLLLLLLLLLLFANIDLRHMNIQRPFTQSSGIFVKSAL